MVLLRRPPYRAAYEGYLELVRSVWVRLEEPALEAPLENLPYLYQVWCTLEILSAVLAVAAELGYRVHSERLVARDASGYYVRVLPDGRPALVLVHPEHWTTVTLIPERIYAPGERDLCSISFGQRPDVALEVQPVAGATRVYLFDPKYKLDSELAAEGNPDGKPQKGDIDKMHAYRDAIRGTHGERIVELAAIVYPGQPVTFRDARGDASGVWALRGFPGESASLGAELHQALRSAMRIVSAPT